MKSLPKVELLAWKRSYVLHNAVGLGWPIWATAAVPRRQLLNRFSTEERREGAQLLRCLAEPHDNLWKPSLTFSMCFPAMSCFLLHPRSQPSWRPVQNLGTKKHRPLLLPRQAREEIILPSVVRELWIIMEMTSSHSTQGSACFWLSAVLALHCWACYPCWGLQCNSHSFYILYKKK